MTPESSSFPSGFSQSEPMPLTRAQIAFAEVLGQAIAASWADYLTGASAPAPD
jgi:hypothetical protein